MLGFFRRMTKSKAGVFIGLAFLVMIAIGFAVADINGLRPANGPTGSTVASVGDTTISDAWLTDRARRELDFARQRQPTLDMAQFAAAGGIENVLERGLTGYAFEAFAREHGMVVSDRLVDGQIASIPAFQGFNGKFDQKTFESRLAQERVRPDELRDDIRRDTIGQWLIAPTIGAPQPAAQIALPYASLLREQRAGQVALIPTAALPPVAAPSDQQLQAYYNANRARYTVPERRVVRYALVTPASVAAQAAPTDAEVQQAYRAAPTRFAASEKRTVAQVVVADQAGANRIVQAVRGGTPLAAAAQAAGLEATTLSGLTKAELTARTSSAVADAAFAAAQGAVVGPVRSPLGFVIARVEAVTQIPGRTLEQARGELVAELTKTKGATALGSVQEKIDGGITDGATFDEIVADARLTAQATAPVTAAGIDPLNPGQPDPALAQVIQAGFAAEPGDAPQLVQTGADGTFALVATGDVTRAAPRPLAQIREQVLGQYRLDQAMKAARQQASQIIATVNGGTPIGDAIRQTNARIPAPRPINASRADLNRQQQVPPALALLFSMAEKKAKIAPAPDGSGWIVVYLDRIQRGNAANDARAIAAARAGLGQVIGREYVEQFAAAVSRAVGVKKNPETIARVRGELSGAAAPAAQ